MPEPSDGFAFIRDQMKGEAERARSKAEREQRGREAYPGNLTILTLAVAFLGFWCHRHASPFVQQISWLPTMIGTFWLIFRSTQNWVDGPVFREPPRTWTRIFLSQPAARLPLIVLLIVAVTLVSITRSVYFEYDINGGKGSYTIELSSGGQLQMAPAEVNSYDPAPGQIYLNPFLDCSLHAQISNPPFQYSRKPVSLSRFSNRIKIPTYFEDNKRENRGFRIIPGEAAGVPTAFSLPPEDTRQYITVNVNTPAAEPNNESTSEASAQEEMLLERIPWFFEVTYFGGPREMLEVLIKEEQNLELLEDRTVGHLMDRVAKEPVDTKRGYLERRMKQLTRSRRIHESIELKVGDAITVRLFNRIDNHPVATVVHKVLDQVGIQTIILPSTQEPR